MRFIKMPVFIFLMSLFFVWNVEYAVADATGPQKITENPAETNETEGIPAITFDVLNHDFGQTKQNKTLKHVFTFKNTGTGVLTIKKVKGG